MSKYQLEKYKEPISYIGIRISLSNENFVGFPVEVGNTSYDAFLEQAKLTDTQVKALKPDTWYDFPEGE